MEKEKKGRSWMRGDTAGEGRERGAVRRSVSQGRSNTVEMPLLPALVFEPSFGSELHSVLSFFCKPV